MSITVLRPADVAPPDVAPPDGAPPDGAPPDVAPPDGAPPDGAPPDGAPRDKDERLAAARRALDRAETAAGIRVRLAGAPSRPDDDAAGGHPAARPSVEHLPVPAALLPLFPEAGLRRGSVVQVAGSTSLLLAVAAAAGQEGWGALVSLPDVGLEAAAEAGLALERVVLVPRPGPDAPAVLGALVDGFDVLVVGDCRALSDRDRRLLTSRLRSRGSVLLTTQPWPGCELVLEADPLACTGLGSGWGVLEGREMAVRALGRGVLGTGRSVRVRFGTRGLERMTAGTAGRAPAPVRDERQAG